MARGDILTVDLPNSIGRPGHEQVGPRPAIVVQTDMVDATLPTTMIIPMTSNLGALRYPHTFRIDPSLNNHLTLPSVLMVFQLRAIDKMRLGNRIGRLDQRHVQQLETEIRNLLSLNDDIEKLKKENCKLRTEKTALEDELKQLKEYFLKEKKL